MELSVRGATNTYTNNGPNSGDTEMALDMQVCLSAQHFYALCLPKARAALMALVALLPDCVVFLYSCRLILGGSIRFHAE